MHFDKDIFISYAHIDDQAFGATGEGWITNFHKALDVRLAQLLGRKPIIWRDPKLQGNDYFGDEIVDQFPGVALIVSIVSPRYVKSDWCLKEINAFAEVASKNGGIRVHNKSRIFKVIKTHVPFDEHPQVMKDLLGYEFYKIDPETGRAREFGSIYGEESERAYWIKLDDIAHDIADMLEDLSKSEPEEKSPEAVHENITHEATNELNETVYLAETSSDIKDERDLLKRELLEHGYNILPNKQMPFVASEAGDMVKEALSKSLMSIHLVGKNYGFSPEGTTKSIVQLQNDLAAEKSSASDFQRLIWIPPGIEVPDTDEGKLQHAFISSLQRDSAALAGADLFETPLKDFKFAVLDKLAEIKRKREERASKTEATIQENAEGPITIYLICDQRDLQSTLTVEDYLFDQGYEVLTPVFEGDEMQIRQDHQENLKLCDATLIYYGEANELWMRAKQRDLLKVAGYGRKKPLKAKGIYLGGTLNPTKERFKSHDSIVINGTHGFSPQVMQPFVKQIKEAVNA